MPCTLTPANRAVSDEGVPVQVRIVQHAFEIVHLLTDSNPIQVLVEAIINRCAPILSLGLRLS